MIQAYICVSLKVKTRGLQIQNQTVLSSEDLILEDNWLEIFVLECRDSQKSACSRSFFGCSSFIPGVYVELPRIG